MQGYGLYRELAPFGPLLTEMLTNKKETRHMSNNLINTVLDLVVYVIFVRIVLSDLFGL